MNSRKRLMELLSRNIPAVPSVLADTILRSKWLAAHDEAVRAEEREKAARIAVTRADALVRENLALAQERDRAREAYALAVVATREAVADLAEGARMPSGGTLLGSRAQFLALADALLAAFTITEKGAE